jgi:hypothetical protein
MSRRVRVADEPGHLPVRGIDLPTRIGIGLCDECAVRPAQAEFALDWGWPDREESDASYFFCSAQCLELAKLARRAQRQP